MNIDIEIEEGIMSPDVEVSEDPKPLSMSQRELEEHIRHLRAKLMMSEEHIVRLDVEVATLKRDYAKLLEISREVKHKLGAFLCMHKGPE